MNTSLDVSIPVRSYGDKEYYANFDACKAGTYELQ